MSNRNEEQERKSWESSKSESCEEMPMEMYPMQDYNPCMCCPMMYGNMHMHMQGHQMMPKYGKGISREEDFREEEEYRPMHGQHGQHFGHNFGHNFGHHYYHPYYNFYPYPYYPPYYGDWSE